MARILFVCIGLTGICLHRSASAEGGILQMRNGYFWDPSTLEYFIPRGIAYQTWNPPVGADQSLEQFDYDVIEFKKIYANSIRAEFVWNEVEKTPGVFDWSKPDHMVARAEQLGFKLFILVGFQYAPNWFPNDWKATNNLGQVSVVLNYEHPSARAACSNYIYQATKRYRNSAAIGAWILGNEYSYFDLWDPTHTFLGFDSYSQASFRAYLSNLYSNNISVLNTNWGTNYLNFSSIIMPTNYPSNRRSGAFYDLIQWRKKSIGDYVAAGAIAAKLADPNHLRTYSMVGGVFSGDDALNTCEDAKTIVARCAAAGAPLDFWSINNYAWANLGSELRTGDYGIAKYQQQSGLPVFLSETGHSSTETLFAGSERQPKALPSQMWEALVSGAIGIHVFHWSDRELFGGYFLRERGFGIVQQNRLIKDPVYWNVLAMFRQMENLKVEHLFGGSTDPRPDVQYFWSLDGDLVWPRANQENCMLWGALRRAGYQPGIIDDAQFAHGDYTNAPALILSRCMNMSPTHLEQIATQVIPAGIHVYADADFPGQYNAYGQPNTNWVSRMSSLFGLNVAAAFPGYDLGVTYVEYTGAIKLFGVSTLGALTPSYSNSYGVWKIWHGVQATSGTTIVNHTGNNGSQAAMPALQIKNLGSAKTAINTFALADTDPQITDPRFWDIKYDWLRAIFRSHFGIQPAVDLTGTGASDVLPDYRICRDGSVLISLLNEHTNNASITLSSPTLLLGKTVENLSTGGIIETNSDGVLSINMAGDDYLLLYAYTSSGATDQSLVSSNQNKLWFQSAPNAIWPSLTTNQITIGFDTRESGLTLAVSLERVIAPFKTYATSTAVAVSGKGTQILSLPVPDADPNDIYYISTRDGGRYVLHAWLEKNGARVSEVSLPVRLLWAVHPLSLPTTVTAGNTYSVPVEWQELPSYEPTEYPTPLNRAAMWDPYRAKSQFYDILVELRNGSGLVASDHYLTSDGSGQHSFSIHVPSGAAGPFQWLSYIRPAPGTSVDFFDGFENRGPGADAAYTAPWVSYVYSELNNATWLAEGTAPDGSEGHQGAFLAVTNPPNPGAYSGFGFVYTYPSEFSLPSDFRLWTNWSFSFDFKEAQRLPCVLEMQVKDSIGGMINYTTNYTPGSDGWQRVSATLDRFSIPSYITAFNLARVKSIVVNIQMMRSNTVYSASFDRIQFDGQEKTNASVSSVDVIDSFENRLRGNDPALIMPWVSYIYAQSNNASFVAQGVDNQASDGYQGAFMIVQNPLNPGSYSGFGIYYLFTNQWSLPANTQLWSNYWFSFDFRLGNPYQCILDMQIKSAPDQWLSFYKTYTPGAGNWDTVRANLSQFVPGGGVFNPASIQALTINIQMISKNVTYVGSFDNIRFDGPETLLPAELRYGSYSSTNDSPVDSDHDGLSDAYELSIGTNPNNPDSDGDGISDGNEVIAGTNPNSAADVLTITSVQREGNQIVLSWLARTNHVYAVDYLDLDINSGASFLPLEGYTNLTTAVNTTLHATNSISGQKRFYRVTVRSK